MPLPEIVSADEWRAARMALLEDEKQLTKARDAVSAKRRELPMVKVEEDYRFTGPDGEVGLLDLFDGRPQLLVSHFMFDPEWTDGCPSCTAGADEMSDGLQDHLHTRDTSLAYVSRAPIEKIEDYKHRKGWTFPWYSSFGSSFNYDFHVTLDEAVAPAEYNYRTQAEWAERDPSWGGWSGEQPGMSAFLRVGDDVFHTYSSYGRGAEWTGGSYAFLDLTPLGRQEDWEQPEGRSDALRGNSPDFAS
ncbi:DUF899 domain-containing protein [Aquihabitans sp. G128]|uniref:DUF899 domain-containing protein n=1 Tax=Aquihabitans sp. G128 TaxID=2849779 RepID=UPI001C216BFB|nr:DUF899 domain-containing protein [Aquihabitans sp. G128]QXC61393.1 DUF899 domain-containing protein [Aquihabitans sp. G128]